MNSTVLQATIAFLIRATKFEENLLDILRDEITPVTLAYYERYPEELRRVVKTILVSIPSRITSIDRAVVYIATHLTEDLSLEEVAGACGMSEFYFCKMFHKTTGMPFTEYVSRLRIKKAKMLLTDSNRAMAKDICYDVGFGSVTHFNKMFKRFTGTSPSEFRRASCVKTTPVEKSAARGRAIVLRA